MVCVLNLTFVVTESVSVVTNDGKLIVVRWATVVEHQSIFRTTPGALQGLLRGFDNLTNVILESAEERVFSEEEGVEIVELGLYIVRGDNL